MKIHQLPDEVASQIAAGEVVERPVSVVKELVENSIDSGATDIRIRVEGAGKIRIEVEDNGQGIAPDELTLAVSRHATSKLARAEELFQIQTLGFRGEALASIASVSHFLLESRVAEQPVAARIEVEGGKLLRQSSTGAMTGTLVRVDSLFYNVPARLNFLKQDSTERSQIDSFVTRYALAYPHIRFSLYQDGRQVLQTSGSGDRREVLSRLFGLETARQMLGVLFEDQDIRIEGFISPLAITRSNRREIVFFVNGRLIQDIALTSALVQAYANMIMVGRYPTAYLFIQLPADQVDVNVHPAKAEVRFRKPDILFSALQRAARRALLAYSPLAPEVNSSVLINRQNEPAGWTPAAPILEVGSPDESGAESFASDAGAWQSPRLTNDLPLLRCLGQLGATYLVAEGPDGLYLVDQHAAHERILFEQYRSNPTVVASQQLLSPVVVHLQPGQARLLEPVLPAVKQFGFDIEPFGQNSYRIRAVPMFAYSSDPATLLRVLVEDFEEDETPFEGLIVDKLIARICKRVAVKGGQVLSVEEQRRLISDLEKCANPRTCPHGRPTMIHLSVELLERQFGRRGAR